MTLNLNIITTKKEWNICGLRNNFEELKILTEELNLTIVCLQETNVQQEQQTIFGGHEVFSKTVHAVRAKHGVAILVKEGIKSERLK
jgi:exonuclease III